MIRAGLRVAVSRLWALFVRRRDEAALQEEIHGHLDLLADENVQRGLSPIEARLAARRQFGGVQHLKETYRGRRGLPFVDTLVQDVRYACRTMRRAPGFTLVTVLTLAVGIGATTAVFSVVDHVVVRPLAYPEPDSLFALQEVIPRLRTTFPSVPVAATRFLEWRRSVGAFEALALVGGESFTLTGSGEPERLYGARASAALWPMLGIEPLHGRVFLDAEDQSGRDRVVVLSDALWRRRFAADPQILGHTITLDGVPHDIVGVLPPDFHLPPLSTLYGIDIAGRQPELWKPIGLRGDDLGPGNFSFVCIARLKTGVEVSHALAELNAVQAALAKPLGADEWVPPSFRCTNRSPARPSVAWASYSGRWSS